MCPPRLVQCVCHVRGMCVHMSHAVPHMRNICGHSRRIRAHVFVCLCAPSRRVHACEKHMRDICARGMPALITATRGICHMRIAYAAYVICALE